MMEDSYRRKLIRFVTFLAGLYFFIEFILPEKALVALGIAERHESITNGFIAVGAAAFGLGLVNLFMVHGSRVLLAKSGWPNSFALLFGLVLTMVVTFFDWRGGLAISERMKSASTLGDFSRRIKADLEGKIEGVPPYAFRREKLDAAVRRRVEDGRALANEPGGLSTPAAESDRTALVRAIEEADGALAAIPPSESGDLGALDKLGDALGRLSVAEGRVLRARYDTSIGKKLFVFLTEGLFTSLGSAMFSLLAVYIAAAAYRAFRVRSLESFLMMAAAVLVMLGQTPFGLWLYEGLPGIRQWLLEVPNSAAFRAIKIGAAVAALVMSIRMWLSIESENFTEAKK
jgi:hypothetical protein